MLFIILVSIDGYLYFYWSNQVHWSSLLRPPFASKPSVFEYITNQLIIVMLLGTAIPTLETLHYRRFWNAGCFRSEWIKMND